MATRAFLGLYDGQNQLMARGGNSTRQHLNWIALKSIEFSKRTARREAPGLTSPDYEAGEVLLVKTVDAATPRLAEFMARRLRIPLAKIDFVEAGNQVTQRIELRDGYIRNLEIGRGEAAEEETVTFGFSSMQSDFCGPENIDSWLTR